MKAKEYLTQIRRLTDIIRIKSDSLKELESAVMYSGISSSDMPKGMNDPSTKRMDAIVALITARDELAELVSRDVERRRDAIRMMDSLDDSSMRWVLFSRYLEGLTWKEIIDRSGLSERTVYEYHGRGLQEIDRRFRSELSAMQ